MLNEKLFSRFSMVFAVALLGACGGNVEVSSGGDGGEGGTSEGGGGTTTTSNNTGGVGNTGGNTGGTGGNTGGTGGNTGGNTGGTGGNTGGTGGGTGGGPNDCAALDHVSCVGAFPGCVPVYDDECCPSCDPMGGCADCINLQFHHCAPWNESCAGGPPQVCGFVPEWACNGKEPSCNIDPGGSPEPCATEPGCVPAYCSLDADCTTDPVCHPVKPNMCIAACASLPPPCPDGTAPEANGGCWTGSCIPQELCVFDL